MLQEIRIRNLGVIDDAVVRLDRGLTVLTGETGAGKTMVVNGLGLILGARADAGMVRAGAQHAAVEGLLTLPATHPARARVFDAGGELDEDDLIVARTVTAEGRSRAFVGGRSAPVGVLGELGELLVAVHGQADQWRLRRGDQHRTLLDAYGGPRLAAALTAYQGAFTALTAAEAERSALQVADRDRAREVDMLTAALEHLERVDPQPHEDIDLRAEAERLGHSEGLRYAVASAHAALAGSDHDVDSGDVLATLAAARSALAAETAHDPRLTEFEGRLKEVAYAVTDLAGDLASYLADLDADPARLEWVHQRRAELDGLTRRYADTIDDVLAWGSEAARRLTALVGADERLAQLDAEVDQCRREVAATAAALTSERSSAATEFAQAVQAELRELSMGAARLVVAVTPREPTAHGADDVEIQLAANSGAPPRSVVKAASGGELSRVMLAIEVVSGTRLDATDSPGADATLPTFVFDEVDAGVGGAAARAIGARLAALSERAQVVVVTHLAQVAAYADRHLVVRKADDGSVTASSVVSLTGEERVTELARMMGGDSSAAAVEHARELLTESTRRPSRSRSRGPSGAA
ncbi:MAG: DNA repair protein RecN [Dermatophilaceae bacterium]